VLRGGFALALRVELEALVVLSLVSAAVTPLAFRCLCCFCVNMGEWLLLRLDTVHVPFSPSAHTLASI